jgi:NAD-dependent DNA ligase
MRGDEFDHDDQAEHFCFTGPRRLETAMHTLHGLVEGIQADANVNDKEVKRLIQWMSANKEFDEYHPFDEVNKAIHRILADGVVDVEERADLLWLVKQFEPGGNLYDVVTADIQRLHGYLSGILADGIINEQEIAALQAWVDEHEHLKSCWPYDELESIITHVMKDGILDAQEHEALIQFFGEFDHAGERRAVGVLDRGYSVSGVCSMCPEIVFLDRMFCFTGSSERGPRSHLAGVVATRGGKFHTRLTNDSHYLVVGADGNPCWAYPCYGRKVEEAVERRRKGQKLLIVHEYDFWDAVEDSA